MEHEGTTEQVEHASHEAHHQPSPADLFWPALNFAIFAVLAIKYLVGPIKEFFRARTQRIREALAAGAQAKQEAAALQAQITKDLADLPKRRAQMAAELRGMAEQQRTRILAQATAAAARIREEAQLQAEQEIVSARASLRRDIVDRAINEATKLVTQVVTPDDRDRIVREFSESTRAAQ